MRFACVWLHLFFSLCTCMNVFAHNWQERIYAYFIHHLLLCGQLVSSGHKNWTESHVFLSFVFNHTLTQWSAIVLSCLTHVSLYWKAHEMIQQSFYTSISLQTKLIKTNTKIYQALWYWFLQAVICTCINTSQIISEWIVLRYWRRWESSYPGHYSISQSTHM